MESMFSNCPVKGVNPKEQGTYIQSFAPKIYPGS